MPERQEFGLSFGKGSLYIFVVFALFVSLFSVFAALHHQQICFEGRPILGDLGVQIASLVLAIPILFLAYLYIRLSVSFRLDYQLGVSVKGVHTCTLGTETTLAWADIASIKIRPLVRRKNVDCKVWALVVREKDGKSRNINLFGSGLTEQAVKDVFSSYYEASQSLFE